VIRVLKYCNSNAEKENLMRALIIAITLAGIASPCLAQTSTFATINGVRTGWNSDSFAVTTVEPIANPGNCPTPDGYISEKAFPGYTTYYAAALTALMTASPTIVVTVHNTECFAGRPKLIGINLKR
jgi:hypothetical protein